MQHQPTKTIFAASDLARRRTEVIERARIDGIALIRDTDGTPLALVSAAVVDHAATTQRCAELLTAAALGTLELIADWSANDRARFTTDLAHAVERALATSSFAPVEALLAASRPYVDDPLELAQLQRAAAVVARRFQ